MSDLISRQAAINAIKEWGLVDGLSEGQAIEILSDKEKLPSAQPEYTELSPDDVALELSPGDMDGALAWYSTIMKLIQTGHVICRKENR